MAFDRLRTRRGERRGVVCTSVKKQDHVVEPADERMGTALLVHGVALGT
jgi:hypothetical protein